MLFVPLGISKPIPLSPIVFSVSEWGCVSNDYFLAQTPSGASFYQAVFCFVIELTPA